VARRRHAANSDGPGAKAGADETLLRRVANLKCENSEWRVSHVDELYDVFIYAAYHLHASADHDGLPGALERNLLAYFEFEKVFRIVKARSSLDETARQQSSFGVQLSVHGVSSLR
jgi:hypothetical protein